MKIKGNLIIFSTDYEERKDVRKSGDDTIKSWRLATTKCFTPGRQKLSRNHIKGGTRGSNKDWGVTHFGWGAIQQLWKSIQSADGEKGNSS